MAITPHKSAPPLQKEEEANLYRFMGTRLRARRKKLGLTLKELGRKIGISPQQIQKYEMGTVSLSVERMYSITNALGVEVDYFYNEYEMAMKQALPEINQSHPIFLKKTTPLTILIITSDPRDEVQLRKILKPFPQELDIYALHNGQQALELLRNKSSRRPYLRPDVILMESKISPINSLQVLRELKKDPDLKSIPVIILSETLSKQQTIEYYKNYASGFLCKSFAPAEFKDHLYTIITYWSSMCLASM